MALTYQSFPGTMKITKSYRLYGTGILDKHGTMIFEGDIVSYFNPDYLTISRYAVSWIAEEARFGWKESGAMFCKANSAYMEIVGTWL